MKWRAGKNASQSKVRTERKNVKPFRVEAKSRCCRFGKCCKQHPQLLWCYCLENSNLGPSPTYPSRDSVSPHLPKPSFSASTLVSRSWLVILHLLFRYDQHHSPMSHDRIGQRPLLPSELDYKYGITGWEPKRHSNI